MVSAVSFVPQAKTGMQLQDHVDAQLAKAGTESFVSHVSVEDNGMPYQENVLVPMEAGTDSHAFNVPLDRDGIHQHSHAHAQRTLSGMVLTAEHAQVRADTGVIKLTIASAEPETGTKPNVSYVLQTPTGMERPALLVLEVDSGTH